VDRKPIAEALQEMALLGELLEENPFKVRAYARAARAFQKAALPAEAPLAPGNLEAVDGIGKGVASLIREMAHTGRILALEEARRKVPEGVRTLLHIPGLGPKKVRVLWRDLGVLSLGELEYACVENRLVLLPGFGPKSQAKVLQGIRFLRRQEGKALLPRALAEMEEIERGARDGGEFPAAWAGEAGRFCEVVDGLVLLAEGPRAAGLARRLGLEGNGETWRGRSPGGLSIRLLACEPDAFGARLLWETSSRPFRDALAGRLAREGLTWTAAGLAREGAPVAVPTENRFWEACGRAPVPPECRETPEALDADIGGLFSESDLRGSFHVHTDWSDGNAGLEAMVSAAEALGWEYVGICDHSVSAFYAGGLSEDRLREQIRAIRDIQGRHREIRVFAGVESDILPDGRLDYGDGALDALDLVVASVHSRFSLDEDSQTRRLVKAVSNPRTTLLGHPTGRLLLAREAYPFRWEEVLDAARSHGTAVELNANPHRLDVDWRLAPELARLGVPVAVNPDAHSAEGLRDVSYGILMARKGLLGRRDVLNALSPEEASEFLRTRSRPAR